LNEILSFLTFLLSDQLIFHRFINQQQSESPLIKSMKQYQRNLNYEANLEPEPKQFINYILKQSLQQNLTRGEELGQPQ
jgi:hypothetical protein